MWGIISLTCLAIGACNSCGIDLKDTAVKTHAALDNTVALTRAKGHDIRKAVMFTSEAFKFARAC